MWTRPRLVTCGPFSATGPVRTKLDRLIETHVLSGGMGFQSTQVRAIVGHLRRRHLYATIARGRCQLRDFDLVGPERAAISSCFAISTR